MKNTQLEIKTQIIDKELLKYFEGDYLFKLKEKPKQEILNKLHSTGMFWELLVQNLRFSDLKVLEYIYMPEIKSIAFLKLEKKMKFFKIKRSSLRRKIDKFEKLGLIVCIKSGFLFVTGTSNIKKNVNSLIKLCKAKFGMQLL